ncbi:hypothetical protein MY4824_004326 [Beauveria thailandica]
MDGPIRTFTASSTFPQASLVNVNGQDAYAQLQPTGNTPPLPAQLCIVHYFILLPSYSGNSLTYDTSTHTHGWKPETMRPAVLLALALALASVLLAALLEILVPKERRQWRSLPRRHSSR